MTPHDFLKARLALTDRNLNQVLDRLTDADLPWAPSEGMRTVGGQIAKAGDFLMLPAIGAARDWVEPRLRCSGMGIGGQFCR